jgi:hypothetical protein
MNPTQATPQTSSKPSTKPETTKSAPEPDFAEEAAPKSSEFGTEGDAKNITAGDFDRVP